MIDRGNHKQYFPAVTIYGSHNPSTQLIVVQELANSDSEHFMVTHSGTVTTGVCKNI